MTPEQFEKLQELQRLKTEDEKGNIIEVYITTLWVKFQWSSHDSQEPKEAPDPDTEEGVRRRIVKIVNARGLPVLAKLVQDSSPQTRETAARALRQICSDDRGTARGLMAQQGGLKACASAALDEEAQATMRREAAHAVAKTLVTMNPTLLSEHSRLGALSALSYLIRSSDATTLQQFEGLLSITNLVSVGLPEQDRLAASKGNVII